MKRFALISAILFLIFPALPVPVCAQSDSMVHVKAFPGVTVGQKVTNAMATCPASPVPCILVIDASLATAATGTMPTLCGNCSIQDYRSGALAPNLPGVTSDGANGIKIAGSAAAGKVLASGGLTPQVSDYGMVSTGYFGPYPPDVTAEGDSITNHLGAFNQYFGSGANSWVNRGVGGYTCYNILSGLASSYAGQVVPIECGINDIIGGAGTGGEYEDLVPPGTPTNGYASIGGYLEQIVSSVISKGGYPVLSLIAPVTSAQSGGVGRTAAQVNTAVVTLNAWIKNYALVNGFPIIDYYDAFVLTDGSGYGNPAYYNSDGLHPNPSPGYAIQTGQMGPGLRVAESAWQTPIYASHFQSTGLSSFASVDTELLGVGGDLTRTLAATLDVYGTAQFFYSDPQLEVGVDTSDLFRVSYSNTAGTTLTSYVGGANGTLNLVGSPVEINGVSLGAFAPLASPSFTGTVHVAASSDALDIFSDSSNLMRLSWSSSGGAIQSFVGGAYSNTILNPLGGNVQVPGIKSTTGDRYVCVDSSGDLVSSASACSGT